MNSNKIIFSHDKKEMIYYLIYKDNANFIYAPIDILENNILK